MTTVLITQCLQRDFVDPLGAHDPPGAAIAAVRAARGPRALETIAQELRGHVRLGHAEVPLTGTGRRPGGTPARERTKQPWIMAS
jgi:hypothetical protein